MFCLVLAPVVSLNLPEATTIALSWTSAGSVVDSYVVMWERDITGECRQEDEGSTTISGDLTSYDVVNLAGISTYTITVTASNSAGSAVSDAVSRMTGQVGESQHAVLYTTLLASCKIFVLLSVPSTPPPSVSRTNIVPTSFTIFWGQVECIHSSGNITGYVVQYGIHGDETTQTMNINSPDNRTIIISGLTPDTSYSVEVAAVNSIGTGQFSVPLRVDTPQSK